MLSDDQIPAFNPAKFSFPEEPMEATESMKEFWAECLKRTDKKEMPHA